MITTVLPDAAGGRTHQRPPLPSNLPPTQTPHHPPSVRPTYPYSSIITATLSRLKRLHVQKGRLGRRDIPSSVPCTELTHTHTQHMQGTHTHTHCHHCELKSPRIDGFSGNRGINPFCVALSSSHAAILRLSKICVRYFCLRKHRKTRSVL